MKNQKGFAILAISVIMVFIIGLNVFIGSRGSIIEQQSANNLYRTEEAFQNAEKGLAQVIANLQAYLVANPSVTDLTGVPTASTNLTLANVYTTSLSAGLITSVGSGSGNATRTVTQRVAVGAAGARGPAALTALGNITLGGNVSATDVKAGGTVSTEGSGNIGTPGGGDSAEFKVKLLDHNGNVLTDANGVAVTRSMTTEEYFMHFFGGLCPVAKAAAVAIDCEAEARATVIADTVKGFYCSSNCTDLNDNALTAAYAAGKRIFWLEGGLNHRFTLGTEADPVIVLVMNVVDGGDAVHINANSRLNGILYVDILDQRTTVGCSCNLASTATSSATAAVDYTQPTFTLKNGATKCTSAASGWNSGTKTCTYQVVDSHGNVLLPTTTIKQNAYFQVINTISYPTSYTATWSTPVIALNALQPAACTVAACTAAATKCSLTATASTVLGDAAQCSFLATAVSGTNNTTVEIEIVGTWDNSGGGNTVITGAAITSGNFTGQGTLEFIRSNSVITNTLLTNVGGTGFSAQPATLVLSGWSDMN